MLCWVNYKIKPITMTLLITAGLKTGRPLGFLTKNGFLLYAVSKIFLLLYLSICPTPFIISEDGKMSSLQNNGAKCLSEK